MQLKNILILIATHAIIRNMGIRIRSKINCFTLSTQRKFHGENFKSLNNVENCIFAITSLFFVFT